MEEWIIHLYELGIPFREIIESVYYRNKKKNFIEIGYRQYVEYVILEHFYLENHKEKL